MTASVRIEDLIAVHANTGGKGEPLRASRRSTPPPVQRLVKRLPLAGTDETVAQGHAAQLLGHRAGIGPAPPPPRGPAGQRRAARRGAGRPGSGPPWGTRPGAPAAPRNAGSALG